MTSLAVIVSVPPPVVPAGWGLRGFRLATATGARFERRTLGEAVAAWVEEGTARTELVAVAASGVALLGADYDPAAGRWSDWLPL